MEHSMFTLPSVRFSLRKSGFVIKKRDFVVNNAAEYSFFLCIKITRIL